MKEKEIRLLKEVLGFVHEYGTDDHFREDINKKMAAGESHKGRPVFFYIQVLISFSPIFRRNYLKFAQAAPSSKANIKSFMKAKPSMVEDFLQSCYWEGHQEYNRLWEATEPPRLFEESELDKFERLRELPDSPEKEGAFVATLQQTAERLGQTTPELPQSVDQIASKIEDPEKITADHQEQSASILEDKIHTYGAYMVNPENRAKLVEKNLCTDAEIKEILRSGFIKTKDIEPEFNKEEFQSVSERKKALSEAAGRLLKSQIEERIAKKEVQNNAPEIKTKTPTTEPDKKPEPIFVEKVHPKYSTDEELKRFNELMGVKHEPPQIVSTAGKPLFSLPAVPLPIPQMPPIKVAETPFKAEPVATPKPRKIEIPYVVQNAAKNVGSAVTRLVIKNAPTFVSAAIGGVVGMASGNPAIALTGAGVGAIGAKIMEHEKAASTIVGGGTSLLKGLSGLRKGAMLFNPVTAPLALLSSPTIRKVIFGVFAAIFGLLFFHQQDEINKASAPFTPYTTAYSAPVLSGTPTPGRPTPTPGGGGPPVSSSCTFTRATTNAPFASSILYGWISTAAISQGIPPAILAGIAMHESPNVVVTYDNNNDAIKSNSYCQGGEVFCEQSGVRIHGGECSAEEKSAGARTAQAKGLMQLIDIYNPGINVCSITENISGGAQTLKNKIGSGSFDNETQLKTAICRYFGVDAVSCPYGGGDYGQEVWDDYQRCKNTPTPTPQSTYTASCPLQSATITTHSIQQDPINGHCSNNYGTAYCKVCANGGISQSRRAKAIDVTTSTWEVYLPTVSGQQTQWELVIGGMSYPINLSDGGGYGYLFKAVVDSHTWYLDLIHMDIITASPNSNGQYPSGTKLGKYYDNRKYNPQHSPHLHATIGEDIKASLSPGQDNFDCDPGWVASDKMCQ